jgi:hypothetical protein
MDKLLRFDEKQLYLTYDFETTNINLAIDNYVWQVGFIVTDLNQIIEKHNYYVLWDNIREKMSKGAAERTGFNYDIYIKNAKPQEEILEIFEKYLYNDSFIRYGHNTHNFDIFLHNQWRLRNGQKSNWSYLPYSLDTDAIARAWKIGIKSIKQNEWTEAMFRYGNIIRRGMKTRLEYLGPEFGIEYDYTTLHDGLNDCILDYYIFKRLIYKLDI